jgi:RNA polymerase sigma-70 factor (ECF subfamily)
LADPPAPAPTPGDVRQADQRDDSAIIEASLRTPECFAELFDRHAAELHRYVESWGAVSVTCCC